MSGSRTTYKKPSRVYDYNYNLGEHYYKPQLRHADLRFQGRAGSPPKAKTFAERFAENPVYGSYGGASSYATQPRKTSLTDDFFGKSNRTSDRFATRVGQSEDTDFGPRTRINPNDEFGDFGKSRFSFGDRVLDAAGAGVGSKGQGTSRFGSGRNESEPRGFKGLEDAFDDQFFQSRAGKRVGREANSRAEDFLNDESFKLKSGRKFDASATADELMDEMKRDADKFAEASKQRSKLRAQRLQQEDSDFGFGGTEGLPESTESRIEKIRARAKARIAEAMEDDFQAPTSTKSYFDDFDSTPATTGGTKSVRISKRSVKTTFDTD